MLRQLVKISLIISSLVWMSVSYGAMRYYGAPLDETQWVVSGDDTICRLAQAIPIYGQASFIREAGHKPTFIVDVWQGGARKGHAVLTAMPAPWQHSYKPKVLSKKLVMHSGGTPFQLNSSLTKQLYAILDAGMIPTFTYPDWSGSKDKVYLGISAYNFDSAYRDFIACVQKLLPYSYQQMEKTTVYYENGKVKLSKRSKAELRKIPRFIDAGGKYSQLVVNGFTDSVGSVDYNLRLARERVIIVKDYLVNQGIPIDNIKMYAYGKRDPRASNDSEKGRANNRRVTVDMIQ